MIICFMGKTSSGKNTLSDIISKDLNIPQAISTTTRPRRANETQDKEYHFITKEEFDKLDFIERREYKVYDGSIWYYGYTKDEFNHDNCIAIVDVDGYKELSKYFGEDKVVPFLIYSSEDKLRERLKLRGDNPKEINRRLADDHYKFKDFIESGNYYKICNEHDIELAAQEIKTILNKLL